MSQQCEHDPPWGRAGSLQPTGAGSTATSQPHVGPGTRLCPCTNKGLSVQGCSCSAEVNRVPASTFLPAALPDPSCLAPPAHRLGTPTTREGWIPPWQQPPARTPSPACRATTQPGK